LIRRRLGVRRDYESLYSLGVAFTAYAAAEAVHGSGFLAAFTAGITIAALDVELCDCFIDYGGATAEMALLFTFVLFGASLIWSGFTVVSWSTLAFAVVVILVRPPVFLLSLAGSRVERGECFLIAWFGPRGLSSLLLVLLPVFAGLPGSEHLFAICCLVVLLSVVVNGGSPMLLGGSSRRRALHEETPPADVAMQQPPPAVSAALDPINDGHTAASTPANVSSSWDPEVSASTINSIELSAGDDGYASALPAESLTIAQLRRLWDTGVPIVILDVRTDRTYNPSSTQAHRAVRLPPDHVAERASELNLPREAWLVAYCA
jgi:sodium/hydrogen antiporter